MIHRLLYRDAVKALKSEAEELRRISVNYVHNERILIKMLEKSIKLNRLADEIQEYLRDN